MLSEPELSKTDGSSGQLRLGSLKLYTRELPLSRAGTSAVVDLCRGIVFRLKEMWEARPAWFVRRKGIRRFIVRIARNKRELLEPLPVEAELRHQTQSPLRRHINRLLIPQVKCMRAALVVVLMWLAFVYPRYLRFKESAHPFADLGLLVGVSVLVFLPTLITDRLKMSRLPSVVLMATWTALLSAAYGLWHSLPSLQRQLGARTVWGLFDVAHGLGTAFAFSILFFALSLISIRYIFIERANPDAVLVNSLLEILSILKGTPLRWNELSVKRALVAELETAASTLEEGMPSQLQTGNLADDRWLKEMASKNAAALRRLKRWVLMPKSDTKERFTEQVTTILISVLKGDWDGLPRVEPDSISISERWAFRIGGGVRIVVTGFLPAAAVWACSKFEILTPGPFFEYLAGASLVWALVVTISSLDPLYSARVDAFKHLFQLGASIKSKKPE